MLSRVCTAGALKLPPRPKAAVNICCLLAGDGLKKRFFFPFPITICLASERIAHAFFASIFSFLASVVLAMEICRSSNNFCAFLQDTQPFLI
jgi:hypothetical protein